MKKAIWITIFCLTLIGCNSTALNDFRDTNRKNLAKLNLGMTKQEVTEIMGTKRADDNTLGRMYVGASVTSATNPYRTEILQGKDRTFEVWYYYTDVKREDSAITDDELAPLVFDGGKLVGWGWGFLQQNIEKYEIRIR
jgi:hypothetical protein